MAVTQFFHNSNYRKLYNMYTAILPSLLLLFTLGCSMQSNTLSDDTLIDQGNGTILSEQFQLQWQQSISKRFDSAEEAQEYVQNLTLGGHSDWRIPTKAESHNLYFSMDFGKSDSKDMKMKMDSSMWVVLDDGTLQAGAWDAGETCCIVRTFKKDIRGGVRAVRP